MNGRRTLPALATALAPVALAVALAVPLVLLHGTYRALYPLFLLAGVAVRALGGRVAQVIALIFAILLGPLVWHLGTDGGAAEMTLAYASRASSWRECMTAAPATKMRTAAAASAGRAISPIANHQRSTSAPRATRARIRASRPSQ